MNITRKIANAFGGFIADNWMGLIIILQFVCICSISYWCDRTRDDFYRRDALCGDLIDEVSDLKKENEGLRRALYIATNEAVRVAAQTGKGVAE